jgi:LacI family transcriptional regulator
VPVTLKDIARDVGVSVVTVSKVLRNAPGISTETRQRVLKRMKELRYRPNMAARALVTGRTHCVGLIVPHLVQSFFAELAKGLSAVLRTQGYSLMITSSEEDVELERHEIEQLTSRRVDALLVASTQLTGETFRRLEELDIPFILIDRRLPGLEANFVGVDDEAVGEMATEHLIANGYRRIAHIGGRDMTTAIGRQEGYRRALAKHNLEVPPEYVVTRANIDQAGDTTGFLAMNGLLQVDPRPDAVFCGNDPLAIGAMKAILDAGLRIPDDVAIIGCGNVRAAEFLRVPLSSVAQQTELLGETAAKLALSLVEGNGNEGPHTVLLEACVVARASSAPRG